MGSILLNCHSDRLGNGIARWIDLRKFSNAYRQDSSELLTTSPLDHGLPPLIRLRYFCSIVIKQSKLDFPVIVSPLYGVFSPETIALGTMLDAYFESSANAKFYLEPLVQKGAKNTINVNNSKFLSGALILPLNKNEQQKIADCLSSIDKVITAQTQKLGALKAYKKGLMQKLFPAMDEVA